MAEKCKGCSRQLPDEGMQKPSPEQIKAFMEQQKKIQEIQKALLKDMEPLQKKTIVLFKAMKKCKECKESKYKFIPCEGHYALLKELAEKTNDIRMYYGLKQQLAKLVKIK